MLKAIILILVSSSSSKEGNSSQSLLKNNHPIAVHKGLTFLLERNPSHLQRLTADNVALDFLVANRQELHTNGHISEGQARQAMRSLPFRRAF